MTKREATTFQKTVYRHYRLHGRDLPWRRTHNPYRILVSEVMLQQTQVDRVLLKYRAFLRAFPSVRRLAQARLPEVLRAWQGLGYNRRAKFLREAAQMLVRDFRDRFPKKVAHIEKLPGVGPYTARAIATFAFGAPEVFIETNIRTVFLHHFFKNKTSISDKDVLRLVEETLDKKNPREWYFALMDYGAHLKKTEGNPNRRSAHYTKQSTFVGSNRQLRGLIIKAVLAEGSIAASALALARKIKKPAQTVQAIADTLVREGFLKKTGKKYTC